MIYTPLAAHMVATTFFFNYVIGIYLLEHIHHIYHLEVISHSIINTEPFRNHVADLRRSVWKRAAVFWLGACCYVYVNIR